MVWKHPLKRIQRLKNDNDGETDGQESEVEPPRSNENYEHPSSNKKRKRLSEKQLKNEYINLKREEYEKRQKRHEERCLIEKELNEIDKRKLEVLEEYLKNKTHK
ncbi:hypothetical protein JTB14_019759 [Gonioctena quinquepunctata]|nr:hypothetical protein JTB14_019759 [Gonioctena quinquepunctata]